MRTRKGHAEVKWKKTEIQPQVLFVLYSYTFAHLINTVAGVFSVTNPLNKQIDFQDIDDRHTLSIN